MERKRIVVLSDSDGLSRAIELNLRDYPDAEIVRLGWGMSERRGGCLDDCSLIIVATSACSSEPVVGLARASLIDRIGQVPVLIISGRRFEADPMQRIAHLDFPFSIEKLHHTVGEMLYGARTWETTSPFLNYECRSEQHGQDAGIDRQR